MAAVFAIEFTQSAAEELEAVRAFYRRRIAGNIDSQLAHEPLEATTNRKPLLDLQADFEHGEPLWELRVGRHRVYCDVSKETATVTVRAVREKPPHSTTDEVL